MDPFIDFHSRFSLDPKRCALLIIDMQYASGSREHGLGRLLAEQGRSESARWRFDRLEDLVIPNMQRLLAAFRENQGEIVYVTLGSASNDFMDVPRYLRKLLIETDNRIGAANHEILEEVRPQEAELVVNKTTASAFLSTDLDTTLRDREVDQLLLTGLSTNACVEGTGRDGADLGYDCLLVEDACSCANEMTHQAAVANFGRVLGRTASTGAVLAELSDGGRLSKGE